MIGFQFFVDFKADYPTNRLRIDGIATLKFIDIGTTKGSVMFDFDTQYVYILESTYNTCFKVNFKDKIILKDFAAAL